MGCYIDPPTMEKESFLKIHGKSIPAPFPTYEFLMGTHAHRTPVILIDNGIFTAAGICYCEKEYNRMALYPHDKRPKLLFMVITEELFLVSDLKDYLDDMRDNS